MTERTRRPPRRPDRQLVWHKVADVDALADGRVMTVTVGPHLARAHHVATTATARSTTTARTRAGPLGEGSIEKGWLRCPWHGYDYDPITGTPPPGFTDAPANHPVEVRADGIYVALPPERPRARTISDLMVETMIAWGVTHVFGMVGHSNLGFADAMRAAETRGDLTFIGIRHEGAAAFAASAYGKLTGRLAACFAIAGPGLDEPAHRPVRRQGRPRAGARDLGPGSVEGPRPGRVPGSRPRSRVRRRRGVDADRATRLRPRRADEPRVQARAAATRRRPPRPTRRGAGASRRPPAHASVGRAGAFPTCRSRLPKRSSSRRPRSSRAPGGRSSSSGTGPRRGIDDVVRLAERLHAPILTTFKAKGIVADDHPLACGVLGRSGTPVASWHMNESDLLIVFGASFAEPHRYRRRTSRSCRSTPIPTRSVVSTPSRSRCSAMSPSRRAGSSPKRTRAESRPIDQRTDVATRRAIWHEEKVRRGLDDHGARRRVGAALRSAWPGTRPKAR